MGTLGAPKGDANAAFGPAAAPDVKGKAGAAKGSALMLLEPPMPPMPPMPPVPPKLPGVLLVPKGTDGAPNDGAAPKALVPGPMPVPMPMPMPSGLPNAPVRDGENAGTEGEKAGRDCVEARPRLVSLDGVKYKGASKRDGPYLQGNGGWGRWCAWI